jgi:hypothetical protein
MSHCEFPSASRLSENVDRHDGFFDAVEAAAVFLNCDSCVFDLPMAGLAAQLGDKFVDLPEARRADRVAF